MIDVVLACGAGLITIIMTYLGVHLTLHPAESARERRLYKIGFILCAFVVIVLTGAQSYRSQRSQSTLDKQIRHIDENTPPLAAYLAFDAVLPVGNFQPFTVGRTINMNIYFKNTSVLKLANIHHYGDLTVGQPNEEREIRDRYHEAANQHLAENSERLKTAFDLEPRKEAAFFTVRSTPLTESQINGLLDGSLRLYLNTYLDWQDRDQVRSLDACYWLGLENDDLGLTRGRYRLEVCRNVVK